jgi:hypothetical protein
MTGMLPELRPLHHVGIPSFAELQQIDNRFFGQGRIGTHRDELPDELHEIFWSWPDNARAMALLGYEKEVVVWR